MCVTTLGVSLPRLWLIHSNTIFSYSACSVQFVLFMLFIADRDTGDLSSLSASIHETYAPSALVSGLASTAFIDAKSPTDSLYPR